MNSNHVVLTPPGVSTACVQFELGEADVFPEWAEALGLSKLGEFKSRIDRWARPKLSTAASSPPVLVAEGRGDQCNGSRGRGGRPGGRRGAGNKERGGGFVRQAAAGQSNNR